MPPRRSLRSAGSNFRQGAGAWFVTANMGQTPYGNEYGIRGLPQGPGPSMGSSCSPMRTQVLRLGRVVQTWGATYVPRGPRPDAAYSASPLHRSRFYPQGEAAPDTTNSRLINIYRKQIAQRKLYWPVHGASGTLSGLTTTSRALGFAMLAQAPRQGVIYLGVGTGRCFGPARGAAQTEAAEMSIYLGPRERLGHEVCWVLCAQHLM